MTSEATQVQSLPTTSPDQDLKSVDLSEIKDVCPAFINSCPYANVGAIEDLKNCPEFKDGCPYKTGDNMADVYNKLSQLPGGSLEGPHGKKLSELFMQVHEISKELEASMGKCPVFSEQGCPFKTVCSDGEPLISKLDTQQWTAFLKDSADGMLKDQTEEAEGLLLSKELKAGSWKLHREVQKVHFIRQLVRGKLDRHSYKLMLAHLYFVYSVLEEESEKQANDALFKAIHYPKELNRKQALEEDLEFYYGPDWKEQIEITPATQEYCDQIKKASAQDPVLLIAHHYTRYLGDLSGGQVMSKVLRRALDLPEEGGVSFFEFEHVASLEGFKNMYRSKLDQLSISKEKADDAVKEAVNAYMLNINLFKEIDALMGYEAPEPKKPKEPEEDRSPSLPKSSAQCPFATLMGKPSPSSKGVAAQDLVPTNHLWNHPLVWAFGAAILAVVVGLLVARAY